MIDGNRALSLAEKSLISIAMNSPLPSNPYVLIDKGEGNFESGDKLFLVIKGYSIGPALFAFQDLREADSMASHHMSNTGSIAEIVNIDIKSIPDDLWLKYYFRIDIGRNEPFIISVLMSKMTYLSRL